MVRLSVSESDGRDRGVRVCVRGGSANGGSPPTRMREERGKGNHREHREGEYGRWEEIATGALRIAIAMEGGWMEGICKSLRCNAQALWHMVCYLSLS